MEVKKLRRSHNKKFLGVCSGIGEYLDRDPTVIRLLWVIISFCTGLVPGLIAYLVCGLIMENPS